MNYLCSYVLVNYEMVFMYFYIRIGCVTEFWNTGTNHT